MNNFKIVMAFMVGFVVAGMGFNLKGDNVHNDKKNVDLPEEYKEITKEDRLCGYFTQDSTLVIEFNNDRNNTIK